MYGKPFPEFYLFEHFYNNHQLIIDKPIDTLEFPPIIWQLDKIEIKITTPITLKIFKEIRVNNLKSNCEVSFYCNKGVEIDINELNCNNVCFDAKGNYHIRTANVNNIITKTKDFCNNIKIKNLNINDNITTFNTSNMNYNVKYLNLKLSTKRPVIIDNYNDIYKLRIYNTLKTDKINETIMLNGLETIEIIEIDGKDIFI